LEGDKKCAFCHLPETIQHLFFYCTYAKFLWHSVHILFGIDPHVDIADLFDIWSKMETIKHNTLLLSAAAALCWAIWITRNELVFDKCRPKTFFCRYSFGELIGYVNGQSFSVMRIVVENLCKQPVILNLRHCTFFTPMAGFLLGELVLHSHKLYFGCLRPQVL